MYDMCSFSSSRGGSVLRAKKFQFLEFSKKNAFCEDHATHGSPVREDSNVQHHHALLFCCPAVLQWGAVVSQLAATNQGETIIPLPEALEVKPHFVI